MANIGKITGKRLFYVERWHCVTPPRQVGRRLCPLSKLMVVAIAWALIGSSSLHAQKSNPREYEVKAAYLYNFGKFIQWPAKAAATSESFAICVLGRDPFGTVLDSTISGESINSKNVIVKRIASPEHAESCRILFISSSEAAHLQEILAALANTSVLTVSDIPQFTREGGMVQFVIEANRVRFEVNLTTTERASLVMSSQLLRVATTVRRRSQPRG